MQQFFIFFLAIFCISTVSAQTQPARKKIIAVVGDNNLPDDHPNCKLAEALGQALVDNGYRIIHGG
nr:hypothetical protein [Cytophagales bacterium]